MPPRGSSGGIRRQRAEASPRPLVFSCFFLQIDIIANFAGHRFILFEIKIHDILDTVYL
jgi:hypothetical protein